MTRCIIHIGMHKTGSTSIQHSLHGLDDNRFLYARLGDDPNHSLAMYSLFAPQPGLHHIHRSNGADAATIATYVEKMHTDLEQAIAAAKGRTLVISGEDISAFPRDGLVKLRDYFDERFDDVTVVGYVRAPTGLMTSSFQHRVKIGGPDRFDPDRQYRSYRGTFGNFDEVFGREKVNLWKFDIGSFPEGCAVRDFCTRLDIDLPPERIVRLNEALPRQVVALLYTYYRAAPNGASIMSGPEREKLLDCLAAIGKDPFRMSADVIKPILDKHRADITWMEARLGKSLQEEIGDHRIGDVRDESDLLRPDPIVTRKLLGLLGNEAPSGVKGETPEEVAQLVHRLRELGSRQSTNQRSISAFVAGKIRDLQSAFQKGTESKKGLFSALGALPWRSRASGLQGSIDGVFSDAISGWVYSGVGRRVAIIVRKNGEVLGECVAGKPRLDLVAHGFGDGAHGFLLPVPPDFAVQPDDVIEVVDSADQARKLFLKITPRIFRTTMGAGVITPAKISGWVYLPWQPKQAVIVQVLLDQKVVTEGNVTRYLANVPGVGHGRMGFSIPVSFTQDATSVLSRLALRCVQTGRDLPITAEATIPGRPQADTHRSLSLNTPERSKEPLVLTENLASKNGRAFPNIPGWNEKDIQLDTLRAEIQRLRALVSDQESEIELNLTQLRSMQDELEYWFAQYQQLKEKSGSNDA